MNHLHINHNKKYVSVDIAIKKFLASVKVKPKVEAVSIYDASFRVLSQDIKSKIQIPSFDKSSMDGFAIKSVDTTYTSKKNPVILKIKGKIFAGENTKKSIKLGETFAIATGGPIPKGADSVIMIENVKVLKNKIMFSKKIKKNSNLALKGEEVKKNQLILKKGTWLTPQDIGLIASIGLDRIPVFSRPSVGILATGNELTKPGNVLKNGKIFESNRIVIAELVKQMGGKPIDLGIVKDDKKIIKEKIKSALSNDMLAITGGSSVGEKDYVPEIINELGKPGIIVKGVAMKPGSPVALGVIKKTPVIVCPGFPVSGFFAFSLFGTAVLRQMLSTTGPIIAETNAIMKSDTKVNQNVTNFVRVKLSKEKNTVFAKPVSTADSRLLITLTDSDGVIVTKNVKKIRKGEKIKVTVFRNFSSEKI